MELKNGTLNFSDPAVTEIAALAGYECVWLDMEHVPHTDSVILNPVRAAKMHDGYVGAGT